MFIIFIYVTVREYHVFNLPQIKGEFISSYPCSNFIKNVVACSIRSSKLGPEKKIILSSANIIVKAFFSKFGKSFI